MIKNQKVADYYDKLYSEDNKAFSGEPLPLVTILAEHLPSGRVLEIGAGTGRNALFLASKGYEVRATDISAEAVKLLEARAKEAGLKLNAAVSDIAQDDLQGEYDAIICTFTFHHLTQADAEAVIAKMQRHTAPGGFNLITTFTKNGDFFKGNPDTPNFYLDNKEQLERLYEGWKVIKSFEREGWARSLDNDNNRQANTFAGLLAQKVTP